MGNFFSKSDPRLEKVRVVIIGGSLAGIQVAQDLERCGFDVTVIEPRDHLFIPFGAMRASTSADSSWAKRVCVPLDRALKNGGRVIRGWARGVNSDNRSVSYETPSQPGTLLTIVYDYLVLATGANYSSPFQPTSTEAHSARISMLALGTTLRAAKKVVVVGGGPCGIEMCGEIKDAAPNASVTLIHSGATLCSGPGNASPPRALSEKLLQRLAARQILVNLNVRVSGVQGGKAHPHMGESVQVGPCEVTTSSGSTLKSVDAVIYATGSGKPATAWLAGTSLEGALDDNGGVRVSRAYLVPGFDNRIFAAGDCTSGPDAKAGWLLTSVAQIISANIKTLALRELTNKTSSPLKLKEGPKDGFKGILAVPIGAKDGAGLLPFGVVGPFLIKNIKGGDLFLSKMSGIVGYSAKELVTYSPK